jgi:hypothetical protein
VGLLAPLAALAASPARANVSGNLEVQSQTTQNALSPGAGTTQSTLLMESLSLHYAGLPFGPEVAVATLGGAFSNVTGWGQRLPVSGRVYSFDTSVGFLPRRAVPLRLYGAGTVEEGASGALATRGPGLSVLYGASMNAEPGPWLPGLRLDANEARNARPGHEAMSDVQRHLAASGFGSAAGQRVNLAVRLDEDHRDAAGTAASRAATLDVSSTLHQTTFIATETRRSAAVLATLPPSPAPLLPPPSGITTDRMLGGSSNQRWSSAFSTQVAARVSEAGADAATGRTGELTAGLTWVPLRELHQLTLSGSGSTGFTRTSSGPTIVTGATGPVVDPGLESSGTSWGAGARAAYGRPLGPFSSTVSVGGAVNGCRCGELGSDGTTRQVDGTLSLVLLPAGRTSGQLDYTLVGAYAPLDRGGDRLEHHVRTTGRLRVGESSALGAGLGYDDGFRELFDITTGRTAGLRERAVTGSFGASTQLGRVGLSSEVRHSRGTVVTNGTPFVAGGANQVRSLTSGYATASWSAFPGLGFQAQLVASRADLTRTPGMTSAGANAALVWRVGRTTASLQYQGARVRIDGSPATFQQSIRTMFSRPFEVWR